MAINGDTAKGVAIGVGIALLAPVALASLAGVGRPAARAAIKAGLLMYEKGLETAAELGEILEDLVAEAEAEIEADRAGRSAASEVGEAPSSVAETGAGNASEPV